MSTEAVEILIKADDQASQKFDEVSANLAKSMEQATKILRSLEEPSQKWARQLEELRALHATGAISAEQFAAAEANVGAKLKKIADDESAKKMAEDTKRLEQEQRDLAATMAKAEAALRAWETPAENYKRRLQELKQFHASGAITAEQYATAQSRINAKLNELEKTGVGTGKTTKAFAGFASVLANLTGNSQVATLANQVGEATERVDRFAEATKGGGAGALLFKAGLVALAAGGGFAIGKMFADLVWETELFERRLAVTKEQAAALDQQLKSLAQNRFSEQREDIELIRDPDAKRSAYQKLFGDLQRDIQIAAQVAKKSEKDVESWIKKWKITGDQKQYFEDAKEQAKADRERVDALKAQAQQIGKLIGQRAQQNELLRAENAAKDKSEAFIDSLRKEVEYLNATREEQIKLDAARNTVGADQGEAERLLRERDAIQAKAEAAKELEATQKRAQEETARAAKQAADDAANERKRMMDLEKSIQERIDLRYIELTQGKEAARVQELINQGLDATTAKRFAAQEAQLEQMGQKGGGGGPLQALSAMEGRLLTRGPGRKMEQTLEQIAASMRFIVTTSEQTANSSYYSQQTLTDIKANTARTTQLVPVI